VLQLHDATTQEVLEVVIYMGSVPRCYNQDYSRVYSVAVNQKSRRFVRQPPASKGANTEAEEATALEAVTRRRPVKTQQTEKT
jgi:hypothetical protein